MKNLLLGLTLLASLPSLGADFIERYSNYSNERSEEYLSKVVMITCYPKSVLLSKYGFIEGKRNNAEDALVLKYYYPNSDFAENDLRQFEVTEIGLNLFGQFVVIEGKEVNGSGRLEIWPGRLGGRSNAIIGENNPWKGLKVSCEIIYSPASQN